jgi:hypothetical protein
MDPWRTEMRVQLPWNNLTELSLHHVPVDVCIELLKGCPDLTYFASYRTMTSIRVPDATGPATVLSKLECLKWDYQVTDSVIHIHNEERWNLYLLQWFEFPALRHIGWTSSCNNVHARNVFSQFITEAPHLINTFELLHPPLISPWLESLLKTIPRFDTLICVGLTPSTVPRIIQLIQDATSFPSFQTLRCVFTPREHGILSSSDFIEPLCDMAMERKAGGAEGFYLEIDNLVVDWAPPDRARISQLKADGFNLQIVQNGCKMDF